MKMRMPRAMRLTTTVEMPDARPPKSCRAPTTRTALTRMLTTSFSRRPPGDGGFREAPHLGIDRETALEVGRRRRRVPVQRCADQPRDVHEAAAAVQEGRHRDLVGGVQHDGGGPADHARLPGQPETREPG